MFMQTVPAITIILMFVASATTLSVPIFWSISWWLTGCLCVINLAYVKGEDFGGIGQCIASIAFVACLGFVFLPFAVIAIPMAISLLPRKWMKEAEERDQMIVRWTKEGYPKKQEFKGLW